MIIVADYICICIIQLLIIVVGAAIVLVCPCELVNIIVMCGNSFCVVAIHGTHVFISPSVFPLSAFRFDVDSLHLSRARTKRNSAVNLSLFVWLESAL